MKLYVYDHCPFCAKARMIFGLKSLPLELNYLLENDADTPTRLVGKKTTPILQKADGSHMAESMESVSSCISIRLAEWSALPAFVPRADQLTQIDSR